MWFQGPGWWYEPWGVADWLSTLFDQPIEIHTFLLGALIGLLVGSLTASRHSRTALTVVIAVVLLTFGALQTMFVCSEDFTACQHLRIKP